MDFEKFPGGSYWSDLVFYESSGIIESFKVPKDFERRPLTFVFFFIERCDDITKLEKKGEKVSRMFTYRSMNKGPRRCREEGNGKHFLNRVKRKGRKEEGVQNVVCYTS